MATVLEEFLIKLGFQVDPAQHSRFQDAMKSSHERVEAFNKSLIGVIDRFANLSTVATGAAAGLSDALLKIGHNLGGLSFAAERIGSSPEKITAYENAIKMLGGTVEGARASLETVARAQRENPGILQALFGVKPGTDPVTAMREIGQHWAQLISKGPMGMAQALAEAKQIGLDQADVLRLSNQNFDKFYTESQRRVASWGADMNKAADLGRQQEQNLDRLKQHFQGFTTYLYETFGPMYVHGMEVVNHWFDDNAPKIKTHIDNLKSEFDGLTGGLSEMFKSLSPKEQAGVEIGGAVAGGALAARVGGSIVGRLGGMVGLGGLGKLTGLGLFATVLGGIINDYETWKKDSSQSFIDWSAWEPSITAATKALGDFNDDIINPLAKTLGIPTAFTPALEGLAAFIAGPALAKAVTKGGLGLLLRALALIPGSGISVAMLAGLGIAAGLEVGKNEIGSDASEKAIMEGKNLPDLGGQDKMSPAEASRRVQADVSKGNVNEKSGWFSRGMSALGIGGQIDPGQAHSADEIVQYFMSKGWTKEQAAGVAANAIAESGGKPRIINASGHAGLFQWDQARQQTFARMFGHTMTDQSVSDNQLFLEEMDFANWELHNTESVAGKRLSQTTTAGDAAVAMGQGYERYASGASPEDAHRAGLGEQIAARQTGATTNAVADDAARGKPFGNAPLITKPGETTPDQWAPDSPFWRGISQQDLTPKAAPATPSPAEQLGMVSNDNSKSIQVSDNSVVNVSGVSDPDRAANLINRNRDRVNANVARHLGSLYA